MVLLCDSPRERARFSLGLLISGHLEVRPSATGLLGQTGWPPFSLVLGHMGTGSLAPDLVNGRSRTGWVGRAPCWDPSSQGKTPAVPAWLCPQRSHCPDEAICSLVTGFAGPFPAAWSRQLRPEDSRGPCHVQTQQLAGGGSLYHHRL